MKPALRRSAIAVGVLAGLYTAAGVVVVPRVVRQALVDYVQQHGYQASAESIRFNPFTLELHVGSVVLGARPGERSIVIDAARVTLGWRSLFGTGLLITQIDIKASQLRATRQADGQLDLSRLLPKTDPTTPWPNLSIQRAALEIHHLEYEDPTHGPEAQIHLNRVVVSTHDFVMRSPTSVWTLELASDRKESASAQVRLSLSPLQAQSTLTVQDFRLARLGPKGFGVAPEVEGLLSAEGDIQFLFEPAPTISIGHATLKGDGLSVKLPGEHAPEFKARSWSVEHLKYESAGGTRIDNVALHEPELLLTHTAEGWTGLGAAGGSNPSVSLGAITVDAGHLHVSDRVGPHGVEIDLNGIGITLAAETDSARQVEASAHLSSQGDVEIAGTLGADFLPHDVAFKASHVAAVPFAAYLEPLIALRIDSGFVSGKGQLQSGTEGWRITADAALDSVRTHDVVGERDFLGVRHLDALGIEARWPEKVVHARQILAEGPYADVRIARDGQINVTSLMPERSQAAAPAVQLAVDSAEVHQGRVYFSDESQTPSFDATIGDLEGRIDALSSDPSTRSHLAFKGRVDRYAPVSIEGDANLLSDPIAADVRMHFENLELTGLSPYSGRIAGYRIRKGKATADLTYRLADHRLEASHRVRLRQFELGDRVQGQPGFGVPLGLIVALLKDRDGNIDLDVPLTGNLKDPNFHLGQTTRKVLGNLFGKIAASPFALLGSLFGSGEEISWVEFTAGTVELDNVARERLATLAKAMSARPGISLEIPIATTPTDAEALAESRYHQLLVSRARELLGDQPDALLLQRLNEFPEERRNVLRSLLGPDALPPDSPLATLESALRQRTLANQDDLEQLGSVRAASIQSALIEGTGVSAERVYLVRGSKAEVNGTTVRLKLGLK